MRFVKTVENLFGLPQGFTRVEFLESTNQQNNDTSTNNAAYIDTGVTPDSTTKIECRAQFTTLISGNNNEALFGTTGVSSSDPARMAFGFASVSPYTNFYMGLGIQNLTTSVTRDTVAHTFTIDASTSSWKIDDTTGTFSNPGEVIGAASIYLFARNYAAYEYANKPANAKLYYCKIWKNGVLIRDLVPCLDNNNVPCMYDLIGKKSYYNQGTRIFTTGRQIIPVEYLEGTGTQYIDTGLDYFADFEVGIQLRTNVSNKALGNGAFYCMQRYNAANPYWYFTTGSGTSNSYASSTRITEHHVMKWKDNKIYSDDVLLTEFTKDSNTQNRMCLYATGSSNKYPNVIYFCKLWNPDTGELVRDFIPCKDENDIGFLFDKVSGECYLNSGTGDFTFGENKYKTKLRLIKDNKLPAGYTQVEYLESSGTQYIDTGIKGKNNLHYKSKINFTTLSTSGSNGIGGEYLANASAYIGMVRANGHYTYLFNNTAVETTTTIYTNTDYEIDSVMNSGSQVLKVNGETISTGTLSGAFISTRNIFLYAVCSTNDAADVYGSLKMYYCQIYDNDILVRDFIPCIDENLTPCMYDMVTRTPFYNAGTGTFVTGKPVLPMVRFIKDIVPREYAIVNYIESTNGSQYINTGYIGNSTTRVIIGASSSLDSSNIPLFGARDTNGYYNSFSIWQNTGSNGMRFDYTDTTANVVYSHTWLTTGVNIIEKNGRYNYVNGVQVTSNNEKTFSCNNPFYLMSINTSGIALSGFIGSVSFCKIYDNGTLVRNFIPVIRRIDKIAGMWDTVTKQFFGNSGTGNFNYGV